LAKKTSISGFLPTATTKHQPNHPSIPQQQRSRRSARIFSYPLCANKMEKGFDLYPKIRQALFGGKHRKLLIMMRCV
jgi:hypothetical protein